MEIKKLGLEAQIKVNTTSPLVKPETVPSLSTVCQSPNASKSLGQFDYNVRIVALQEWPHLHVPFDLAKMKFKDLSLAEFVYGYLDIMWVASDEQQQVMSTHLMTLIRLAAKYKWLSVLSFHAALLDRIEAGLASWEMISRSSSCLISQNPIVCLYLLSNKICPQLVRQGLHLKHIVKNGTELALALTNLTRLALSMCVHTANCLIIQWLPVLIDRQPHTHPRLQVPAQPY